MSADNGQLSSGRISSAFAREPAREILPEQRGALQRARDTIMAAFNSKTVFDWSAVGAILLGCWFIRGISKDIESVSAGLADVRIEMRAGFGSIDARMSTFVTREQADDIAMRRVAEARVAK